MTDKLVRIKHGVHRGREFRDVTLPLVTNARKSYHDAPDYAIGKTHRVEVLDETNKKIGLWVTPEDIEYLSSGELQLAAVQEAKEKISDEQLSHAIATRFDMMDRLVDGVIDGHITSMIVSGSPGVGKTFTLDKRLKEAEEQGRINQYTLFGGYVSPLGLYQLLYNHSSPGDVLVLDDTDCVFADEDTMGMLKIALDTSEERVLRWMSHSKLLSDLDIPTEFNFCGRVVFISNQDFERAIESQSKLAPHMQALISRSVFIDLLIHGVRETLIRIEQVVWSTDMLDKVGITDDEDKEQILGWLRDNVNYLRQISLREVLRLAAFYQMDPTNWTDYAWATLFKPSAQRMMLTGELK